MAQSVEYDRLESYITHPPGRQAVICAFKTNRFGYYQVEYRDGELNQLDNEPSLDMFSPDKLNYMRQMSAIAKRLLYDAPAATDRFE